MSVSPLNGHGTVGNPFVNLELAEQTSAQGAAEQKKLGSDVRGAASKDQAPSTRDSTVVNPLSSLNTLTSKFDVTKIPIDKLHQMRRDPMIAFALFFVKASLMRARWVISCEDAQVAAFVDNALREIYSSLAAQYLLKLDYGWSAVVKRFTLSNPDWTYIDPTVDATSPRKLVWDQGSIQAVTLKPFIPLPPESADPIYDNDGSFAGITYKPVKTGPGANTDEKKFDVLHSLWFTNERDSVWGSLWGYPRTGYAYRFWWSFWFNWGLADRHFEKDSDPPAVVRYPSQDADLLGVDGKRLSTRDMALNVGEKARSNSVIALPSETITSFDEKPTAVPKWSIDFLRGGGNFSAFKERFDQLQVLILRACLVPEQAFIEGSGGTSSRNVAGELQDAFVASQVVLMQEFDQDINRFLIPQLVAANFPDKVVRCRKVTKSYDVEDLAFAKQIIQLIGQNNPDDLQADIGTLMEVVGIPRLAPDEIAKKEAEVAKEVQAQKPEATDPGASGDAPVDAQGFYVTPRETISLSSGQDDARFYAELALHPPLADERIFAEAEHVRDLWKQLIGRDYDDAAGIVEGFPVDELGLAEAETFLDRFTRRARERAVTAASRTQSPIRAVMQRGAELELERIGVDSPVFDPSTDDEARAYALSRVDALSKQIPSTTSEEIASYLRTLVSKKVGLGQIPKLLESHFRMFSQGRADTVARGEIGQAYNRGVLYAASRHGVQQVQARSGQLGPGRSRPEAIERNGKLFTIPEALGVQAHEQPNSTLEWRMVPTPIEVMLIDPADADGFAPASVDENNTVWLSEDSDPALRSRYLIALVDAQAREARDDSFAAVA